MSVASTLVGDDLDWPSALIEARFPLDKLAQSDPSPLNFRISRPTPCASRMLGGRSAAPPPPVATNRPVSSYFPRLPVHPVVNDDDDAAAAVKLDDNDTRTLNTLKAMQQNDIDDNASDLTEPPAPQENDDESSSSSSAVLLINENSETTRKRLKLVRETDTEHLKITDERDAAEKRKERHTILRERAITDIQRKQRRVLPIDDDDDDDNVDTAKTPVSETSKVDDGEDADDENDYADDEFMEIDDDYKKAMHHAKQERAKRIAAGLPPRNPYENDEAEQNDDIDSAEEAKLAETMSKAIEDGAELPDVPMKKLTKKQREHESKEASRIAAKQEEEAKQKAAMAERQKRIADAHHDRQLPLRDVRATLCNAYTIVLSEVKKWIKRNIDAALDDDPAPAPLCLEDIVNVVCKHCTDLRDTRIVAHNFLEQMATVIGSTNTSLANTLRLVRSKPLQNELVFGYSTFQACTTGHLKNGKQKKPVCVICNGGMYDEKKSDEPKGPLLLSFQWGVHNGYDNTVYKAVGSADGSTLIHDCGRLYIDAITRLNALPIVIASHAVAWMGHSLTHNDASSLPTQFDDEMLKTLEKHIRLCWALMSGARVSFNN